MNTQKHNPHCRLVSDMIGGDNFVYGQDNKTEDNKGLEVYFYKAGEYTKGGNFYYSRRFLEGAIPTKYQQIYNRLKSNVNLCPDGHILYLNQN